MELSHYIKNLPPEITKFILDKCSSQELGKWRKTSAKAEAIVDRYLPSDLPGESQDALSWLLEALYLKDSPFTKRFKLWSEGGRIDHSLFKKDQPREDIPEPIQKLLVDLKVPEKMNSLCHLSNGDFLAGTLEGEIYRLGETSTLIKKFDVEDDFYPRAINDIIELQGQIIACAISGNKMFFYEVGVTLINLSGKVLCQFSAPWSPDKLILISERVVVGLSMVDQRMAKWYIGENQYAKAEVSYPLSIAERNKRHYGTLLMTRDQENKAYNAKKHAAARPYRYTARI